MPILIQIKSQTREWMKTAHFPGFFHFQDVATELSSRSEMVRQIVHLDLGTERDGPLRDRGILGLISNKSSCTRAQTR